MTRPLLLVLDDGRKAAVDLPPCNEHRRPRTPRRREGVRETQTTVLDLENVRLEGRPQGVRPRARRLEGVEASAARAPRPRRALPASARAIRRAGRARARAAPRTPAAARRAPALHRPLEGPTQLQRVERVAARNVVEPTKSRPGERKPDPGLQETVDRAEAQRRDLKTMCPLPPDKAQRVPSDPRRCATRRPAGSSRSRRHANASTAAEGESSHWTSSMATSSGRSAA